MMRIALLTHQWPGARMGGIGAYTAACAAALAAVGHSPHVFTFTLPADARGAVPPGVRVHEISTLAERIQEGKFSIEVAAALQAGGTPIYRFAMAALLCQAVREEHARAPFEVVESPEYEFLGLPLLLHPLADLAVVTHLHSGSAINRIGNGRPATPEDSLGEMLEFAAILAGDGLCAPSQRVVDVTGGFVPIYRPVTIIPPFVELPPGDFSPPPTDGPVVFVGRLENLKGAAVLARALPAFFARCPQASLHLLGPDTPTAPGTQRSMRQWMLESLPLELHSRLVFRGECSRQEIDAELAAASFAVVPSLYESFSLAAAEAMAAGRAVVISSELGATSFVGDAGVVFPRGNAAALAEAMSDLYTDRPRLVELARRSFTRARELLAPAALVERRITCYQQAAGAVRSHGHSPLAAHLAVLPADHAALLLQAVGAVAGTIAGAAPHPVLTPGVRLTRILQSLAADFSRPVEVLLYGAGRHTTRLLAEKHLWESKGHRIVGLIDDHPRFASAGQQPIKHLGLPVTSVAALLQRPVGAIPPVILSTDTFQDQFWTNTAGLRARGVSVFRLYES